MIEKQVQTYWARIYMSGPIEVAKQAIRAECLRAGLCVTVEPTTFIYTGGEEAGFVVGLIDYPRFPSHPVAIEARARDLMEKLLQAAHQHSALLMTPNVTTWISKRETSTSDPNPTQLRGHGGETEREASAGTAKPLASPEPNHQGMDMDHQALNGGNVASPASKDAPQDHITLKWGTLKSWHLHSEKGRELLTRYNELGSSLGALTQRDTPEQKELICQMIDECNAPTICLDWDGLDVSKEEAKKYVREYGIKDAA